MKKTIISLTICLFIFVPLFTLALSNMAMADANSLLWNNQQGSVQTQTGLGNQDPRAMAAQVVNILLGFLGIIAVIIILFGGFIWMTAAGNEDKVAEAKRVIGAGVIGLVIILAAFGIAQFVLDALYKATAANG